MGSDARPEQGDYVNQLADHARRLQREARGAIAQGDYARASSLIGDAEMLAEDVHGLVDDIEERQNDRLMDLVAEVQAETAARARRQRKRRPGRIGVAIGASLVMSLALVEC